jgi:hypothetical protein
MVSAFFLISVSFHGYIIHLVPLLTDRGLSAQSAALTVSLAGGTALLGRVGIGYVLDRFFALYVAVWFFCGLALGISLLWSGAVGGAVFVAVVLVGWVWGQNWMLCPTWSAAILAYGRLARFSRCERDAGFH